MSSKRRGRPRRSELPDLGIYPVDDKCWEPPDGEDTEKITYRVQLPDGHRAGVVQTYATGTSTLVAFSLFQSINIDGEWHPVMRIDSWHGTVHRHDFTSAGDNKVTILEQIHPDRAEKTLERWWDAAEDLMMSEWEDNVRRWRGD